VTLKYYTLLKEASLLHLPKPRQVELSTMHTATLSVEANWGNKSNLEKTIDSDLTENKRMENAKMPMRARIMAKTSKPSGPPSTIAKSPGTNSHPCIQSNLYHTNQRTTISRIQKPPSWIQNPKTKQSNKWARKKTLTDWGCGKPSTEQWCVGK
jgi:hypothetical protein